MNVPRISTALLSMLKSIVLLFWFGIFLVIIATLLIHLFKFCCLISSSVKVDTLLLYVSISVVIVIKTVAAIDVTVSIERIFKGIASLDRTRVMGFVSFSFTFCITADTTLSPNISVVRELSSILSFRRNIESVCPHKGHIRICSSTLLRAESVSSLSTYFESSTPILSQVILISPKYISPVAVLLTLNAPYITLILLLL